MSRLWNIIIHFQSPKSCEESLQIAGADFLCIKLYLLDILWTGINISDEWREKNKTVLCLHWNSRHYLRKRLYLLRGWKNTKHNAKVYFYVLIVAISFEMCDIIILLLPGKMSFFYTHKAIKTHYCFMQQWQYTIQWHHPSHGLIKADSLTLGFSFLCCIY